MCNFIFCKNLIFLNWTPRKVPLLVLMVHVQRVYCSWVHGMLRMLPKSKSTSHNHAVIPCELRAPEDFLK